MTLKLMGKKRGMTQYFNAKGDVVVCTVITVTPNVVVQVKTRSGRDGYNAIQLGFEEMELKRAEKILGKPRTGHCVKAGTAPYRHLRELRLEAARHLSMDLKQVAEAEKKMPTYEAGQTITVEAVQKLVDAAAASKPAKSAYVDVTGISKGKGFQGVMKLHKFSGMNATHGAGPVHRHAGSTGMRTTPGRCFPGGPRASRMGNDRMTVQNLRVVAVDVDNSLLLVEGAVPGAKNALVYVTHAKKK